MKIVDLSCDVAGGFAAKILAMSGLEVLRPIQHPDPNAPLQCAPQAIYLHALKRTVVHAGTGTAPEMLVDADVVFVSFDRGKYLGLASEPLTLPGTCIQVTTSTFGSSGPYAQLRGGPLAAWSAGGYLAITGEAGREPLIGPEYLCDYIGGYTAAIAVEAALHDRRRTGMGQHIDISTMEAMLCVHQSTFSRAAAGVNRERSGRYTEIYPLVVLPCKDGHVSLGVVTQSEFDKLLIAIGRPELAADERFCDRAARWQHREALDEVLHGFFAEYTARDAAAILQSKSVASAAVVGPTDVLANPQLVHRRFWARPTGSADACMPGNVLPAAQVLPTSLRTGAARSWPPRNRGPGRSKQLPLAGTAVLDLTAFWAGPSATRCLADLGADVVWVERPRSRMDSMPRLSDGQSIQQHVHHTKMNRHKRSVVLDLETAAGRAAAIELACRADVLIENFRPGTASRLGLGHVELCAANPGLVYVSISGFGSQGPWGDWRSYGPNIEAASSIMARTGYQNGEPLRLGHALPDGVGGLLGALAALRGLRERAERGCGGWFDLSQLEAYVAVSGEDILAASMLGSSFPRIGNRSRRGAIQGVFRCCGDDEWVAIRLVDAADVARFDNAANIPGFRELAAATPRQHDAIERLISSFTASQDKYTVAQRLQEAGLEALAVYKPLELVKDRHLQARGFLATVQVDGQKFALPGSPFHGRRPLADPGGSAPGFGAHTSEVLAHLGGRIIEPTSDQPSILG